MSQKNLDHLFTNFCETVKVEIENLEKEKKKLDEQKNLMKKYEFQDEIIELNVGGMIYSTNVQTLLQNKSVDSENLFTSMFSGRFELQKDGKKR